jgi:CHAT domain-containing protein
VRAAGTAVAAKLAELRSYRRRIDQLLQDARMKPADREKLLTDLADKHDKLERDLLADLPHLRRQQQLDELGPDDLVKALPSSAVFIDLIAYWRFERDPNKKGKEAEKRTPSYVAFVLTPLAQSGGEWSQSIQRIELGEARPINAAIEDWRKAVEARQDDRAFAQKFHDLVWAKIAKALPPETKTMYLAADSDLARIPWGALPTAEGRVLLDDCAVALAPHGAFLLDHLKFPRKFDGPRSVLTLGDVAYNSPAWSALPGTADELSALAKLAGSTPVTLTKAHATADRLMESLPKARYAHLATHGAFQANEIRAERQRAVEVLTARRLGDETRIVAAKNPLGYVGLVLAEGKVLSGMSILDLPLENLQLVTLSACETGLGAYTGGEGVQGLQRAFHMAGCENVVASLWKVNDEATAALMRRFYHHLWVKNEPPIQALRLAQLELYRNPTQVADLVRGAAPKFSGATKPIPKGEAPPAGERAATKLWAAFVLSGVGR